ncbi:helix-turn-helix domain-containing protein [Polymorphospora lycopeni]|uniref:Helix-turn-helix domain-containing protein n=1 Tax=Polymorphospora lycopeni TaxID=3140240 RepID=A0ABV5CL05_9ACTN
MSTDTLTRTDAPILLTVQEAADRLSVSRSTLYALMKSGELRSITIRANRRLALTDVDAYVQKLLDQASKTKRA